MKPILQRLDNRAFYLVIFAFSGLAGLIYESIWSHYLKLFLGHAAYAQTLVLCIFMGGMAAGAWVATGLFRGSRRLLLWYAAVEAVIGVFALSFHGIYGVVISHAYDSLLPALPTVTAVTAAKWTVAALLILPQSVLLGTTFPLMCAGMLRTYPDRPGRYVALLYFVNSLGGAIGVLASGFLFIPYLGLPGTMLLAGACNIAVALLVCLCQAGRAARTESPAPAPSLAEARPVPSPGTVLVFAVVAGLTGLSSFMYEIAWIRMLGLVLGTYTHAFEVMLSAFILGLAIGGFIIRRRIERMQDVLPALVFFQVAMGTLAITTLLLYNQTFTLRSWVWTVLPRTDLGFALLSQANLLISMLIMLPATICAGTTLPLITVHLLRTTGDERSIGRIYATNTLGAILGVLLAVHVLMPLAGLKNLVIVAALIDVAIGVFLLLSGRSKVRRGLAWSCAVICALVTAGALYFQFDAYRMSEGIFPTPGRENVSQVIFHEDGATASVDVIRYGEDGTGISTNGMSVGQVMSFPNPMLENSILLAALPLALCAHPDSVATFGIGTGVTARSFLASPLVKHLDVIEIEREMVEGAKLLGDTVQAISSDPRCRVSVEDAKTFFSSHNRTYDIISADISYVWVSGVSGLFSKEFYQLIRKYLQPDGLYVQWMHKTDMRLFASIVNALGESFGDYSVYSLSYFLIIVASVQDELPPLNERIFHAPKLREDLAYVKIEGLQDIDLKLVGTRRILEPYFASLNVPANSDFYPLVDLYGFRSAFLDDGSCMEIEQLANAPFPLIAMLTDAPGVHPSDYCPTPLAFDSSARARAAARAVRIAAQFERPPSGAQPAPSGSDPQIEAMVRSLETCTAANVEESVRKIFISTLAYLSRPEIDALLARFTQGRCSQNLTELARLLLQLANAVNHRDYAAMFPLATTLQQFATADESIAMLAMLAAIKIGKPEDAQRVYEDYCRIENPTTAMKILLSLANADA